MSTEYVLVDGQIIIKRDGCITLAARPAQRENSEPLGLDLRKEQRRRYKKIHARKVRKKNES